MFVWVFCRGDNDVINVSEAIYYGFYFKMCDNDMLITRITLNSIENLHYGLPFKGKRM